MLLKFLFVAALLVSVNAQSFRAGSRADVTFMQIGSSFVVRMDEEIDPPITIAVSDLQPTIRSFANGDNNNLNLGFEQVGQEWHMIVRNKQDYEQEKMRSYSINIDIDGATVIFQINILNIFDNPPVLTVNTNPCSIPELTDAGYDSGCRYNVYDADGMLGNAITFAFDGNYNEENLFEFQFVSSIDDYNNEYSLIVRETLYYDQRTLYNFRVAAIDIFPNRGTSTNVIVEIIDMPNKEPQWTKPFASARFDEKTSQQFEVIAIDGDTGIDAPISYRIEFEENKDYRDLISIDVDTGIINVQAIDRDALENEFFPFTIFAYKRDTVDSFISGSATLIVDDVNDCYPEIFVHESIEDDVEVIEILEETFLTILETSELYIHDRDLGVHASYDVKLVQHDDWLTDYSAAFNIVPNSGYQRQTYSIYVQNTNLIDYENDEWQDQPREFTMMIVATETDAEVDHERTKMLTVRLLNWNDELPSFTNDEYVFEVDETIKGNELIDTVTATDRDIGDEIVYFINGRINESIAINSESGELRTLLDDVFDYERQTEVFIQVQARDTLGESTGGATHTTFTQVRIDVRDINDETPELKMPRQKLSIRENVRDEVITDAIEAFDPDTTADLKFSIDWDESYAIKAGFSPEDNPEFYRGCFVIEANPVTRNTVFGVLSVNTAFEYNIDYEKYETIYLTVVVEDLNQVVNLNWTSAVLVIQIMDENDNPPTFIDDTLTTSRRVIEEANIDTPVGTILAQDIDGPGNNNIAYSMTPINDTPEDWLTIDEKTGVITVIADKEIDCDVPPRDSLDYRIRLYDGANETFGNIAINIIDTNNKHPQLGVFESEIRLYENATTGDLITNVVITDQDRDAPHNIIQFNINYVSYPNLYRYFAIDQLTGELIVSLNNDNVLDRDNGEATHQIYVNFEDNYQGSGTRNGDQTIIQLILLDVNDNAPEMPTQTSDYATDENAAENLIIDNAFYAPDKDDPETPNSQVLYEIVSIEPIDIEEEPEDFAALFTIESYDNKYGRIKTTKALRGYSGRWAITIRAYDLGDLWESRISLSSTAIYYITVAPINFNDPQIVYPRAETSIRLAFDAIVVGESLQLFDGSTLTPFEAIDDDAGTFGDITFEIDSVDSASFIMVKLNRKQSELRVTNLIEEKTYTLNVIAYDGGRRSNRVNNVRISFVDKTSEPAFSVSSWTTDFTENEEGLDERRTIPIATDPKNFGVVNEEELYPIYYFIDESYESADLFALDKSTRVLTLKVELDREEVDLHFLKIIATNFESYPSSAVADSAIMLVEITVNDVNDNPPTFVYKSYPVGVSESDNFGKTLVTLHADDPDLNDVVTYFLLTETIVATGSNLEEVKNTAFLVDKNTGALTLNFHMQSDMKGFFEFTVQARDLVDHTDEAFVKIYLVAEANRVTFTFVNSLAEVRAVDQVKLAQIFTDEYEADCIIDEISPTDVNGVAQDILTDLRVHFVKNDEALEKTDILKKSNDIVFITGLHKKLVELSINLQSVPEPAAEDASDSTDWIVRLALILLAAILAVLLILIVVLYFLKMQALNRQIKALSDNSSTASDTYLHRNEKALPNTNIFSVEKSNPVMNQASKMDLDTESIASSDSDDFADIANNPIFDISPKNPLSNTNSSYI